MIKSKAPTRLQMIRIGARVFLHENDFQKGSLANAGSPSYTVGDRSEAQRVSHSCRCFIGASAKRDAVSTHRKKVDKTGSATSTDVMCLAQSQSNTVAGYICCALVKLLVQVQRANTASLQERMFRPVLQFRMDGKKE